MSDEQPESLSQTEASSGVQRAADGGGKPPLIPILAVAAILLLALWVGLTMRPGVGGRAGDESGDLRVMKAELAAAESELNALRVSMGLRPKENTFEPIEDVAARMKKDADTMIAMARTFQSSLTEKDTLISAKTSEIIQSEQTKQILVEELEKLRKQLGGALSSGAVADSLRQENEALKAQRDSLAGEVARLKAEVTAAGASMPADELARWERKLEEASRAKEFLESRVGQLERELSKARLFANSENELLPAAIQLVRALRKLENKSEAEISAEYANLGVGVGASVLHMLAFDTGSANLTAPDQDRIRSIVADVPDGDLVLCIGYASETGNVDGNRELSSARATAAAELYSSLKRPGQLVQAVYLGQTDRFSNSVPERNQVVEIWRIRKQ